ncbi:MMPL family transporter [Solwaraspora sp. WMMB335]|uniref:MMPL family transporter n=1 Tax=Solwaraspora sp. WMMB335 TaxID=3404118 RepID=UPI003B940602
MFTAIGRLVVRRTKLVLFGSLIVFAVTVLLGSGVFNHLLAGGFEDPGSESSQARRILAAEFDSGTPDILLVATARGGDVDAAVAVAAGADLSARIAAVEGIREVTSYWDPGSPPSLRSADGSAALILARSAGDEQTAADTIERVREEVADVGGPLTVEVGGPVAVGEAIGTNLEHDLLLAETIAVPLTMLLLVLVFRGVVAAALPLVVGGAAVSGAFFVLWSVSRFTDVSVFSINLVTALSLGLAIDYALLLVSRFREELAAGHGVDDATIRTVESAGRTIAFSGVTVAVSLLALIVFPMYFLRSFAYAGVGVLLVAVLASVVTLPAVLKLLGHRVDAWRLPGTRHGGGESHRWGRVAEWVLRRPGRVTVAVLAFLLLVGAPFLDVEFGTPDARALPGDDPTRVATERAGDDFDSGAAAFPVVVAGSTAASEVDLYLAEVSRIDDVAEVVTARGVWVDGRSVGGPAPQAQRYLAGDGEWFEVVPSVAPMSARAEDLVHELRALDPPFEVYVGGSTAQLVDTKSAIFSLAPWAGLWIAVATFVLLFLMFGSVLVPVKAILLNTLSLTATFGAMVWIFQEGNLAGVLGFTATGLTDTAMVILMFAIAFGLSMDYEVFLLARIKEEYDRTGDNHRAIVTGLARTGRIVTAAALVLSITFFAFASSGVTFMKMLGLGLAIAVLVDAFVIRAALVPALMRLAGAANWWAPAWARRLHARIGIDESAALPDPVRPDSQPEHELVRPAA